MITYYGTNLNDGSWSVLQNESYTIYGWSILNAPGDEGPTTDNDGARQITNYDLENAHPYNAIVYNTSAANVLIDWYYI
jgi:hypothetical protein